MNKTALIIIAAILAAVLIGLVVVCFLSLGGQNEKPPVTEPSVTELATEAPTDAEETRETVDEPIEEEYPTQTPASEPVEASDPTNPTNKPTNPTSKPTNPTTKPTNPTNPTQGEQTYTITYTGLSDATHTNPATYTAKTAASITLQVPTGRSGYTFDGWYLNGQKVTSLAGKTGNLTLEARWSKTSSGGGGGAIELPDVPF